MNLNEITTIRKQLHQHPELSGAEQETAKFIIEKIKEFTPNSLIYNDDGSGVIATIDSTNNGKHVIFRCELDGLPIQEVNTFEHQSKIKGVSHKCGHDGHMSIMLNLIDYFASNPPAKGKISFLFQPAEENGTGAKMVLKNSTFFKKNTPDFIFALHNVPGYRKHSIYCKEKNLTPSVISVKIKFFGKTSHAGEPEKGKNPSYAVADLLLQSKMLEEHNKQMSPFGIITPIHSKIGSENYGISAGYAEQDFTLRTWKKSTMHNLREKLINLIIDVAQKYHLTYKLDWFQEFASVNNHPEAVSIIENSATKLKLNYIPKNRPFPWGEDFGLLTEKYKGAMFCIGAGKTTPALHNPDYDFPDEIIETGTNMFIEIFNQTQEE